TTAPVTRPSFQEALTQAGTYAYAVQAVNVFGQRSALTAPVTLTFTIDTVPPVTTISYSTFTVVSGTVTISTTTRISLTAVDFGTPTSGVALTKVAIDAGPFTLYASSFVITSTGTHTLQWFSHDNVGN